MTTKLRVDWPLCQGRGLCHELLPEVIGLDEWGFPIIRAEVTDRQLPRARRAVAGCPAMALRLQGPAR